MDKQLAFIMISFFVACSVLITWAVLRGPKRNELCKWMASGYITLLWMSTVSLTVLTILY
jgi:hypothetical protein